MQVLDADDAASPSDDSDLDDQVCLITHKVFVVMMPSHFPQLVVLGIMC